VTLIIIVAWVLVLVASTLGLIFKDVRYYGLTLFVSLVMIVLFIAHEGPRW